MEFEHLQDEEFLRKKIFKNEFLENIFKKSFVMNIFKKTCDKHL